MLARLGFVHKPLHQTRQLLLADVLAAESLLELWAALVQRSAADEAGHVHHTAWRQNQDRSSDRPLILTEDSSYVLISFHHESVASVKT